jgi:hypothetical protein
MVVHVSHMALPLSLGVLALLAVYHFRHLSQDGSSIAHSCSIVSTLSFAGTGH